MLKYMHALVKKRYSFVVCLEICSVTGDSAIMTTVAGDGLHVDVLTVMSIFFLHIKCSSIQVYLASVSPPATIVHIEIYGYEKITVYSRALKPQ